MLIERLFRNKGGSLIPFGPAENPEIVYHFKPVVDGGPHVCEVDNEEHIERFLSLPEGYREVGKEKITVSDLVVDGVDFSKLTNEELIESFRKCFGKEPGGRMSRDGVIKKLIVAAQEKKEASEKQATEAAEEEAKKLAEGQPPQSTDEDAFEASGTAGNPHAQE